MNRTSKHRRLLWRLLAAGLLAGAVGARGQSITGFSPGAGQPGDRVDISISGFSAGVAQVQFDTVNADFDYISATLLRATVPTNGLTGQIRVIGPPPTYRQAVSASTFYVAPRIDSFFKVGSGGVVVAVGDVVQVEGANFLAPSGARVFIGPTLVPTGNVYVGAGSQLQVTVPAGAATGPLGVGTLAGTNFTTTNLVIGNGLVITSFLPTNGTTNAEVILEGGNFTGVTNVTFNGVRAPTFYVSAPNQIHAFVPSGATTGPIGVQKAGLTSTSNVPFTVTGIAPIITGFTPSVGKATDWVVIDGFYFSTAFNVSFNGTNASFDITADTQIIATVPAGVTAGPITVSSLYGTGVSASNFLVTPLIDYFDPTSGKADDPINIFGQNFSGITNVLFGGVSATFTFVAQNQITAHVPLGASNGPITVISPAGSNTTSASFTVYAAEPVITGFDPLVGLVGDQIRIFGANFHGVTNVSFGGVDALVFAPTADSLILAEVPPNAVSGPIRVSGPGGTAVSTNDFYLPPRVTGLAPLEGVVGDSVVLNGTNFTGVAAVEFTASNALFLPATSFTVTATQVVAVVPTNALTGPLRLTAPAGLFITTNSFSVLPKVHSFTPNAGSAGTLVTISGAGFNSVTSVRFGGVEAVFTNNSTTEAVAVVPTGAPTGPVTVTTGAGASASADVFYVTTFADLYLVLNASPGTGRVGRAVTYTLTAGNAGPSLATSVRFTNSLPTNAQLNSFTNTAGLAVATNNLLLWTFPLMSNLASATLTVVVTPTSTNPMNYAATATSAQPEVNALNNQVSLSTPVLFTPPVISGFSPAAGPVTTLVTISGSDLNNVTNVSFGGVSAPFTKAGSTNLLATVPSGAGSGPVRVKTAYDTVESAGSFEVTTVAGVSVRLSSSPPAGFVNRSLTYTALVSNSGPSSATSLQLTNTLPASATYLSATASVGGVTRSNVTLTWNFPLLAAGAAATLTVTIQPTNTAMLESAAGVTAAEFDPDMGDNTALLATPVVSDAQRVLSVYQIANSADLELRWPVSSVSFILQGAENLSLSNVPWMNLDLAGAGFLTNSNGVFHVFTNSPPGGRQFFRLKYP